MQSAQNTDAPTDGATKLDGPTVHIVSLTLTKIADGLIDPKLVLSWLLNALQAPGYLIGMLVPVREAGALLPQLALAQWIEARRRRKWFWAAGSALQGLSALGMAAAAIWLEGATAGWVILGCLALLACARAACSASHKDILARTVEKGERGTVSGTAGSIGAAVVLGFAVLLGLGIIPLNVSVVSGALAFAGLLWILASLVFSSLREQPVEAKEAGAAILQGLAEPLRRDPEFRAYLATRALLIATALAPPFIVMLSGQGADGGLGNLGLFMLASAGASIVSARVWGWFSDRSSRQTLMVAGFTAGPIYAGAAVIGRSSGDLGGALTAAICVFLAQVSYEGARAGRKTHLTDMDTGDSKTTYTALSNTLIGSMLLLGGGFGVIADLAGPAVVLALFAAMSVAGGLVGASLSEVQQEE